MNKNKTPLFTILESSVGNIHGKTRFYFDVEFDHAGNDFVTVNTLEDAKKVGEERVQIGVVYETDEYGVVRAFERPPLKVGDRVETTRPIERYPHFVIPGERAKGTVVEVEDQKVSIRMDDEIPGAEDWDNEVIWAYDDLDHLNQDVRPIEDEPTANNIANKKQEETDAGIESLQFQPDDCEHANRHRTWRGREKYGFVCDDCGRHLMDYEIQ